MQNDAMATADGLKVERQLAPGRITVMVRGEIDQDTSKALVDELCDAIERSPETVVDLSGVTFVDAAGVGALIGCYPRAMNLGHRMYVVNAHAWVARLFEITGVKDLLAPPESSVTG